MLEDTIYTGTTGLLAFSRGLNVISNNVANLNTPGFKGNDLLFSDLFYRLQIASGTGDGKVLGAYVGEGVTADQTFIRFNQGELQDTGNSNDVAIQGNGFFITRRNGEILYTRAGQFEINGSDRLIMRDDGAQVMALGPNGALVDFSIAGLRSNPPRATTQVSFVNNLSSDATDFNVPNVQVFNSQGIVQTLNVRAQNNSAAQAGSWLIDVTDQNGKALATAREIRFQANGSPAAGFNQFSFSPAEGQPNIRFFFGTPGSFTGATSFAAGSTSTLAVGSQNGRATGSLTETSFDEQGYLQLTYSNGQTAQGPRLALAWFSDLQQLMQLPGARFQAAPDQERIVAGPADSVMGTTVGQNIELSNVEVTSEFTDLIIDQRGYQSSSQVISVANEMMQELLTMTRSSR
jgi:flagellar hook protein FlgE